MANKQEALANARMYNTMKAFEEAKAGDIVICCDEYSHDYDEHVMLVQSVEDDPADICEDNPKGRRLYGRDLSDDSDETMICMVHPGNFVKRLPMPTTCDELCERMHFLMDTCFTDELFRAWLFDFNVKMHEKDIILAWKRLEEQIMGSYVYRTEAFYMLGDPEYSKDEEFIPKGEYEDIYEGNCKDFLYNLNDIRFHTRKKKRNKRICLFIR